MTLLSDVAKRAAVTLCATVGLVACASNPASNDQIAVAKESVTRAEQSGAPQDAPTELASARDKLARAEKANADHSEPLATRLAEQATVDAQVAEATALQQRAHKAAADFDKSMQTLQQESSRSAESQPQSQPN